MIKKNTIRILVVVTSLGIIPLSQAAKGIVKIATLPGDAKIFINGEFKGNSPDIPDQFFEIRLDEGKYRILAEKKSNSKEWRGQKDNVFVSRDSSQVFVIKLRQSITDAKRYFELNDKPKFVRQTECDGKVEKANCHRYADFEFDEKGHLTKELYFSNTGELEYKILSFYDEKDRLTHTEGYYADGNLHTIEKVTSYNSANFETKVIETKANGEIVRTKVYEYNDDNNRISLNYFENGKIISKLKTNYKNNQKDSTEFYDETGKLISKINYINNEEGLIVVENQKIPVPSKTKYSYIYDEKNNWVKKVSRINGKVNTIWEREINYFD